ncbi:MAG TPA: ribonuclease HI [Clostridiaceae bacterium]|nr:ribonuclease HI [Clostridiaceae bacterium]
MNSRPVVDVYTDGSCSGNPGPGGWAAVIIFGNIEKEISGGDVLTTNNRMEMIAAIEALKQLKKPCRVRLHSDSAYLVNAFTNGWIESWKKNGWKNSTRQTVSNIDLWQQLDVLSEQHDIEWIKVKGHSGHKYNERCDALAVKETNLRKT